MFVEKDDFPRLFGHPESFILDDETGAEYGRILAGLCWPGVRAGYFVVIGEARKKDETLNAKPLKLLAEYEHPDLLGLVESAAQRVSYYKIARVYGDSGNLASMQRLYKSRVRLHIASAPFIDDTHGHMSYLGVIRQLTASERKILTFGSGSKLPAIMAGLSAESIPKSRDSFFESYPQLTALGFCCAAMTYLKHDPAEEMMVAVLNSSLSDEAGY